MHYKEWIKKYSPTNEIFTFEELAEMLGKSSRLLRYYLNNGYLLKDQKKPKLFKPEEVK